ncbi:unnamed protein product [Phyllotreta striolata]|uniref:Uncharacterized protein n=1 Tax=Phyllotreta striolata TaxID=444603 RepID=A0A9N9TKG4_PHYSR|nr:unnamed protein product [Phyllotreta striolata]
MKLQKMVRVFTDRHLENIGNVFEALYKDCLLTDCVLYCKDGAIKAHKVILAASSRYFKQVFLDHADDNAIFMYGISYVQLKHLVDLIYRGSIDVPGDNLNAIYSLLEELKVNGVAVDATRELKTNGIGRDTRFKGQKRVAVDFDINDAQSPSTSRSKTPTQTERRTSTSAESASPTRSPGKESGTVSGEVPKLNPFLTSRFAENVQSTQIHQSTEGSNSPTTDSSNINGKHGAKSRDDYEPSGPLSVWARKERKFKCDLCPSSFKRASHLSRHQLVHTGERPFACDQCDKAFSRHDKLKHHVHKTHELHDAALHALNEALGPDSLYTIDHVDILTPETNMVESSNSIVPKEEAVSSVGFSEGFKEVPQKKGRGRPRKYPPVPKPLFKRPRGRPRINPVGFHNLQGYQNLCRDSFEDLGYLYKESGPGQCFPGNSDMEVDSDLHEQGLMEPLVEIKTEALEKNNEEDEEDEEEPDRKPDSNFFEKIGLFENSTAIAKIGECTISVAPSTSNISESNGNKADN